MVGLPDDLDRNAVEEACATSRRKGKPVRVADEYLRPGWTAPMPLYVLWCDRCRMGTVTHPAGKGRISCHKCRASRPVWTPWKTRHYVTGPLRRTLPLVAVAAAIVAALWLYAR